MGKINVKNKKTFLVFGCALIAIAVLLLVYFALILTGVIGSRVHKLYIVSGSAEKIYDGTPLTNDQWQLVSGELRSGHTLTVLTMGSQTEIGNSLNSVSAVIRDKNGADVTDEYEIEFQCGTLAVFACKIALRSASASKVYDGHDLAAEDYVITGGSLREGDFLVVGMPSRLRTPGTCENLMEPTVYDADGKNVTASYLILFEYGTLEIRRIPLTVMTTGGEKIYDGAPLEQHEASVIDGVLMSTDTITYTFPSGQTDVGSKENVAVCRVTDSFGRDMTDNYEITSQFGTLTVHPRPITVMSATAQKVYDGTPLTDPGYSVTFGELAEGEKLSVGCSGSQIQVGSSENFFTAVVRAKDGRDVTSNYEITSTLGLLTVVGSAEDIGGIGGLDRDIWVRSEKSGKLLLRSGAHGDYSPADDSWSAAAAYSLAANAVSPLFYTERALADSGNAPHAVDIVWGGSVALIPAYSAGLTGQGISDSAVTGADPVTRQDCVFRDAADAAAKPAKVPSSLTSAEAQYAAFVRSRYLGIPAELLNPVRSIISKYQLKSTSASLVADLREAGVRLYKEYVLPDVTFSKTQNPLLYLLTKDVGEDYQGVDPLVTALTLVCRSLGVPARPVSGYAAEVKAGQWTKLDPSACDTDFVEIYLDGMGWILVDIPASAKHPDRYSGSTEPKPEEPDDPGIIFIPPPRSDTTAMNAGDHLGGDNDNNRTVVAVVKTGRSAHVYLRETAYGVYNEKTSSWTKAEPIQYTGNCSPLYYMSNFLSLQGKTKTNTISVRSLTGAYLAPYYPALDSIPALNDIDFAGVSPVEYSLRYFDTGVPDFGNVIYGGVNTNRYDKAVMDPSSPYCTVPASTRGAVERFLQDHGYFRTAKTAPELLKAVAAALQTEYAYKKQSYPAGVDHVSYFLETAKSGICQQFAASATMIFRALGYPARYTVGYAFDTVGGKEYQVTDDDAHAWVEVYNQYFGWVMVEVTGADDEKPLGGDLVIRPKSAEVPYNGTEQTAPQAAEILRGTLPEGCSIRAQVEGGGTRPGVYDTKILSYSIVDSGGNDITSLFNVTVEQGTLVIRRANLHIRLPDQIKLDNGIGYNADNTYELLPDSDPIAAGETLKVTVNTSVQGVGSAPLKVGNVRVYDAHGNYTTDFYNVTVEAGTLRVVRGIIYLETGSATKTYDGKPLLAEEYSILHWSYIEGDDAVKVSFDDGPTEVGVFPNIPAVTVTDREGNNRTGQYAYMKDAGKFGWLTITPAPLVLRTGSATAQGENSVLSCHECEVEGNLPEGANVIVTYSGMQVGVGISDNSVSEVHIIDASGRDITHNFSVSFEFGKLTVEP